ncbi:hypothetical protein EW145_g2914 [Phellinidium pouzarii]|uniref:Elongation factor 1 alpha-like protein n=1 Tax=Phellinidium pouzarii TaxID=167371 RepID=A0A4S4L911_9AGAM|nr:hypothetical protein EW145_g2914 [Phellinidium pouzarii]
MSRHRVVRNINIEEELDDGAISEEEVISISPEEQETATAQIEDAVDQVRDIIGAESSSGISDAFLKDVVWNNYLDVGRSVDEVLEERERRQLASDRRDFLDDRGLPVPPPGEEDYVGEFYANPADIFQQSTGFTKRLSTISERTERTEMTEESRPWPSHQELLAANAPRRPPSTPTTSSYGQVIHPSRTFGFAPNENGTEDERSVLSTSDFGQVIETERVVDPNDIHPSPSLSALRHLSIRTPSPSPTALSGGSASTLQPQRRIGRYTLPEPPNTPLSPNLPSSSHVSETSRSNLSIAPSEARRGPLQTPYERSYSQRSGFSQVSSRERNEGGAVRPKSKLASLASSRALLTRSKPPSEASLSYMSTDSTATYPALRPKSLSSGSTSVMNSSVQHEVDVAVRSGSVMSPDQEKVKEKMMRATKETISFSLPAHSPKATAAEKSSAPTPSYPQPPAPPTPRSIPDMPAASTISYTRSSVPPTPRSASVMSVVSTPTYPQQPIPPSPKPTPLQRPTISTPSYRQPSVPSITKSVRAKLAASTQSYAQPSMPPTPKSIPTEKPTASSTNYPRTSISPTPKSIPADRPIVSTPNYSQPSIPPTPKSNSLERPTAPTPIHAQFSLVPEGSRNERGNTVQENDIPQEGIDAEDVCSVQESSVIQEYTIRQSESEPIISTTPQPSKPSLSKLALLAQSKMADREHTSRKIRKPRVLGPPYATTEYLTPTSNSNSVTTAITTYTQTPDSMVALSRAKLPPSYQPEAQDSPSVGGGRQSKLALKAKKSSHKAAVSTEALEGAQRAALEYMQSRADNPIYSRKLGTSSAAPSPFAALLVDDSLPAKKPKRSKNDTDHEQKSEQRTQRRQRREALLPMHLLKPAVLKSTIFAFDVPSPDDVVLNARRGTALGSTPRSGTPHSKQSSGDRNNPARELEKAQKAKNKQLESVKSGTTSAKMSRSSSPTLKAGSQLTTARGTSATSSSSTLKAQPQRPQLDQHALDISGLNLDNNNAEESIYEAPPEMSLAREKVLEEARKTLDNGNKKAFSLVVIGHVDAGKSTLMGRLLYELGFLDERKRLANERESNKMGKGSFTWAWEMDGTIEERARGVTMDIALQTISTPNRQITVLDAPGHKDFIPNMISGATQADCALLVVDAAIGEFEAGFDKGGQTREHLVLVRSLGVSQIVVAVNKLDQVKWDKDRYSEICEILKPFLAQTGFNASKAEFVPVGALSGVNLVNRESQESEALNAWYNGHTLADLLDKLVPPTRAISAPLRCPISNVFKGISGGTAVSGRLCSGVVQVGEQLRIIPGDESAIVKTIEVDDENVPWAAAGHNVTVYLANVDPIHLDIGYVLCPPTDLVPLSTTFTARIIVFDIQLPITIGAPVELFLHSHNVAATIAKFVATLDRATGAMVKKNPRYLPLNALIDDHMLTALVS